MFRCQTKARRYQEGARARYGNNAHNPRAAVRRARPASGSRHRRMTSLPATTFGRESRALGPGRALGRSRGFRSGEGAGQRTSRTAPLRDRIHACVNGAAVVEGDQHTGAKPASPCGGMWSSRGGGGVWRRPLSIRESPSAPCRRRRRFLPSRCASGGATSRLSMVPSFTCV